MTPSAGRRFGLTVGGAFLVLAVITAWRQHQTASVVFGSIAGMLIAGGLVFPTRLGPVERAWMALAHAISRVTTPIMMAAIYYIVVTPTGVMRRALGRNPLVHRKTPNGFWKTRGSSRSSNSMERQF